MPYNGDINCLLKAFVRAPLNISISTFVCDRVVYQNNICLRCTLPHFFTRQVTWCSSLPVVVIQAHVSIHHQLPACSDISLHVSIL